MHLLLWALIANCWIMINGQVPPRLNIPGAIPVPVPGSVPIARTAVTRTRRPAATLRAQQSLIQPHIVPRVIEDSKPVTESNEEDISESYTPHAPQISQSHSHVQLREQLREQTLTSAQQAQFQQTVAAFLNGEVNAIPDTSIPHLLDDDEPQLTHTTPQYSTRFPERQNINVINVGSASPKPIFNDFGIGSNIINGGSGSTGNRNNGGVQKYGGGNDRVANIPQQSSAQAPQIRDRVSVIRSRPVVRELKPHYEAQSAPSSQSIQSVQSVSRPRVKHIQPRPLIEQNQLSDEREDRYNSKRNKRPVAQTLRKWREEHEDGSITWGYENDDGSFKEEIIGTDCITKGTYGYVDPDGNKREYHYETGIKCDPNRRNTEPDILNNNGFINYDENRAILPNGIEIDMSQLGKKKSRRPVVNYKN